jgi:hypothetical protein
MDVLFRLLNKTGFLQSDIDYHLIRASMVLIFLAFGYQKWFAYEAQVLIPYISNGPLIFWLYPVFGVRGASWFLGVSEMVVRRTSVLGLLGQAIWTSWCARVNRHVHRYRYHHSVHAEWMGPRCRLSCNGRKRSFPNEGRRSSGRFDLLAEAGFGSRLRFSQI